MEAKLTLTLSKSVIEKAKRFAKERNLSLSKLVEEYLSLLTEKDAEESTPYSPIVKDLEGSISKKDIGNWKDGYTRYLMKKYG